LADPAGAIRQWQLVKDADASDTVIRDEFYRSPNAKPLLRWALLHPPHSADRKRAVELLSTAPENLRGELLGDGPEGH
jgi:hypothetical protein